MIIRHGRAVSQGKQGSFWGGAAGGLPSQSRLPPQSAAGQRPTGVSRPRRGSQVGAQPEICRKPSLASPFGGGAPAGGGEGKLLATPPSPWETTFSVRYRSGKTMRCFPSFSLAAAHKVKGKVETFLKKSFIKKLYARFARPPARTCVFLLHRRGVQPPPQGAT